MPLSYAIEAMGINKELGSSNIFMSNGEHGKIFAYCMNA